MVFLEVDEQKRMERLKSQDERIVENLKLVEEHATEQQVKDLLPDLADLRVSNDRPLEELASTLVNWIHQGDGTRNMCAA
jgi:hypothetical protein